jgi:hypothetical protein
MSDEAKWIPPKRAKQQYGLGLTSIYALLGDDRLVSVKIGGRRLISVASLEALFANPDAGRISGDGTRKLIRP